jgi:anti-anti-sigma factor
VVLELQGVLFFGNADDLANEIRNLDERIDTVILDLRRVGDIDTSGAAVLQQIAQRLRNRKRRLVVCGAGEAVSSVIRTAIGQDGTENLFPDLDTALECMEERTLRDASADRSRAVALRLDRIDLVQDMSTEQIRILEAYLENASYGSGTILCREGEPSDRLWILTHGSVSVWIAGDQGERRLTSLGTGTTVGEMGLLEREPRSARVVADEDVECFVLKAEAYQTLLREHPNIWHILLANIAKDMAYRLRVTNEDLRLVNA